MRSLVLLALAVFLMWPVVSSCRAGRVRLRGSMVLTRRGHPVMFWMSMALTTSAALACMALGLQPLLP